MLNQRIEIGKRMSSKSYQYLLRQTLTPVVGMLLIWFLMHGSTTYFLLWTEQSNQRIVDENVTSIRAAESLQIAVWKLASRFILTVDPTFDVTQEGAALQAEIFSQRHKLEESAIEQEERSELAVIDQLLVELLKEFQRFHPATTLLVNSTEPSILPASDSKNILQLAEEISISAQKIFDFNQLQVDQFRVRRRNLNQFVVKARWVMFTIGPLIGVYLGWRLGQRLYQSITRISVTLHDAETMSELETVAIEASGHFVDVEKKAEQVAERMRSVSRELQLARRELLQSERLAAVGSLAAGIAHEIRNPLTSIKLLLQHAVRPFSTPRIEEDQIQLMLDEIGRMETTIQGLLDFSRPPALHRITHDFRQTLSRALNLVESRAHQQNIQIQTTMSDTPLLVDGDTEKLHQLLMNLLINAVEAMPSGGDLTVDARMAPTKSADAPSGFRSHHNDGAGDCQVQVRICDTGSGIAPEILSHLFEPFVSNKERGTGLGLAISRRIAAEHAGSIVARNLSTAGAEFLLTIPGIPVDISVGVLVALPVAAPVEGATEMLTASM